MNELESKLEILTAEFERLGERGVRSAPEMMELLGDVGSELKRLMRQREELASLYDVAQDLAAASVLNDLLESIVDKAIVLVGAERGFVALCDADGGYRICAARRFASGEVEPTDEALSSTLMWQIIHHREPILTTNIQEDGRFELSQSIIAQRIRSVLAVPLLARGELQGAIYVDTSIGERHFGSSELRLLEAMASQAAMAIRSARLYDDARRSNEQLHEALVHLRETQSQLVQAEQLAAVGRLATSVAHELRSPLMVMRNTLYFVDRLVAEGRLDSPDILRRHFAKLDGEIEHQSKIINDLLFFSRNRPRKLTQVDLNSTLLEALLRLQMTESIVVETEFDESMPAVNADADQLQQVFVNLLSNSVQAMPTGGKLCVKTLRGDYYATIEVSDTGCGISDEHMQRLFEPFFTTKRRGIGLGLAVTKSIVDGHRGEVAVESRVDHGTTVTVRLPYELIG